MKSRNGHIDVTACTEGRLVLPPSRLLTAVLLPQPPTWPHWALCTTIWKMRQNGVLENGRYEAPPLLQRDALRSDAADGWTL